jgi:hypothetical protein
MFKAHKMKWGYRDPKQVWHEHEIVIYYSPVEELPGERFIINVPDEIALATGRKVVTGETMEKVREQLNSTKEKYIEMIAPKTKTKIIRYRASVITGNGYYGDGNLKISAEYRVLWVVQQKGRKFRLEEENENGQLEQLATDFDPESDYMKWMPWTQEREDWFKQFEHNLIELSKQVEKFYEENFPQNANDLGKAIDSGNLLPGFGNMKNLLTTRGE